MPIYEYACDKCGTFEVSQRITDKPLGRCPTCKSKVRKLISSTSFQLKGSGWYVTDYAGKNASAAKGKDDGKADSSDTKKESSAESKSSSGAKSEKGSGKSEATAA